MKTKATEYIFTARNDGNFIRREGIEIVQRNVVSRGSYGSLHLVIPPYSDHPFLIMRSNGEPISNSIYIGEAIVVEAFDNSSGVKMVKAKMNTIYNYTAVRIAIDNKL